MVENQVFHKSQYLRGQFSSTKILKVCVPKRASKYMRQKLIEVKEEIDKHTMTVADINIHLAII